RLPARKAYARGQVPVRLPYRQGLPRHEDARRDVTKSQKVANPDRRGAAEGLDAGCRRWADSGRACRQCEESRHDGPFVEAKDGGGFSIVQAAPLGAAAELAPGRPVFLRGGAVEARPLAGFTTGK